MKAFLGWLMRRGILYLALVLAIGVGPIIVAHLRQSAQERWDQAQRDEADYRGYDTALGELKAEPARLQRAFEEERRTLSGKSVAELDRLILDARRDRDALDHELGRQGAVGLTALVRRDPGLIVARKRDEMQLQLLDQRLSLLRSVRTLADARSLQAAASAAQARLPQAQAACRAASTRLQALETRWSYRLRSWLESAEHRHLQTSRKVACEEANRLSREAARLREAQAGVATAEGALGQVGDDLSRQLNATLSDLTSERNRAWRALDRSLLQKFRHGALAATLWKALAALLLIVAIPYLIRLLFWFMLAPIAERRPSIRLAVPGGAGQAIPPVPRSTTSVAIRLDAREELLVRQDYLQTTSHTGAKGTRWMLDWRHPIASIVTGMTFLTGIRGEGEVTTVSAVRDPFAEVAVLALPDGASCVLQPRALAAVAQPLAQPLRITSHWRLFSFNAWLTMQLRYMVFHGPCRLVIKGGRGVRVERAERGRVFGQAQLVGFSADLAYSVTRTETFWPYFLGREQLFKDKVQAGDGVLVIEEAPMAGRGRGEVRHGLEGVFDVMTKALGI